MTQHLSADTFGRPAPSMPPLVPLAPIPRDSRIEWARAAFMAGAKTWAEAIRIHGIDADKPDYIQRAREDIAVVQATFGEALKLFADAVDGDRKSIADHLSDLFGEGFDWTLEKWLEDLGADAGDASAEHRIGKFEALGR